VSAYRAKGLISGTRFGRGWLYDAAEIEAALARAARQADNGGEVR
jgi:hypothetical protein